MTTRQVAAELRATGARDVTARPSQRRHAGWIDGATPARVQRAFDVRATGKSTPVVATFASVTDTPYEMYDMFGPYTEVVALDAFDATLAAGPSVEFTLNHGAGGGLPMAHTRNGTLELSVVRDGDTTGLWYEASVDPTRNDVSDMLKAMERGDLAESSFKFRIVRGQWSPDWMEYHIHEIDIDRGDVSAVNFGANPHTAGDMLKHALNAPTIEEVAKSSLQFKPGGIIAPRTITDEDTARLVLITDADTRRWPA